MLLLDFILKCKCKIWVSPSTLFRSSQISDCTAHTLWFSEFLSLWTRFFTVLLKNYVNYTLVYVNLADFKAYTQEIYDFGEIHSAILKIIKKEITFNDITYYSRHFLQRIAIIKKIFFWKMCDERVLIYFFMIAGSNFFVFCWKTKQNQSNYTPQTRSKWKSVVGSYS